MLDFTRLQIYNLSFKNAKEMMRSTFPIVSNFSGAEQWLDPIHGAYLVCNRSHLCCLTHWMYLASSYRISNFNQIWTFINLVINKIKCLLCVRSLGKEWFNRLYGLYSMKGRHWTSIAVKYVFCYDGPGGNGVLKLLNRASFLRNAIPNNT
jgi:hypothetical protein